MILLLAACPASAFEMDFHYETAADYAESIDRLRQLMGRVPGADVFTFRQNRESPVVSLPILTPTYSLGDPRRYAASNYSVLRFSDNRRGVVHIVIENSTLYIYGYVSNGVFYYMEDGSANIQLPQGVGADRRSRLSSNANYAALTSEINRLRGGEARFSRGPGPDGAGGQILGAQSFRNTINNLSSFGSNGRVTRADALEGIVFLASAVAEAARFRTISSRIVWNFEDGGYVLSNELITLINDWSDAGIFLQGHRDDRAPATIAKKTLTYAQVVGIMGLLYSCSMARRSNEIRRIARSFGNRCAVDLTSSRI